MANPLNQVVEHLHRVIRPPESDFTDAQLLTRFVSTREESSFAALVRRHGPMVWQVCRRILRHVQDAEDAFQATFLVFARKASAIVHRDSVSSFLYGVAYRTALDARSIAARRRAREKQMDHVPHPEIAASEPPDWRPWLDRELHRLPEKYRTAIVLCDLEGRSRKEAARLLSIPEGTLSSRLATGRRRLARSLSKHGLTLSGGALAVLLVESTSVAMPPALASATVQSAVSMLSGKLVASSTVGVLMKGAMKTMLLTKLKWVAGVTLLATLFGITGIVYHVSGQSPTREKRPLNELDALRRENELLKLNLEVVLEKVRAQETELRKLHEQAKTMQSWEDVRTKTPQAYAPNFPILNERNFSLETIAKPPSDPFQEVESALKKLRQAPDLASYQRATEELDKAWKKLNEKTGKGGLKYLESKSASDDTGAAPKAK